MEPVTKNEMDQAFQDFEVRMEKIIDRKLGEKLEQKLDQKLDEKLDEKLGEKLGGFITEISGMFDNLIQHMDERFEMMDRRFESLRAAQADYVHVAEFNRLSDRVTILERKR